MRWWAANLEDKKRKEKISWERNKYGNRYIKNSFS